VFAALTRLPVQPRIHPVEAARIVTENILPHLEVVSLGKEDYLEAMTSWPTADGTGRRSTTLCCAARCAVERIYTFNLGAPQELASLGLQKKICSP
jgi:hypothetical protein